MITLLNKECLPDLIGADLKVIFCGLAVGKESCMMKHYYANPGNCFWRTLHRAGFLDKQIKTSLDPEVKELNNQILIAKKIGLTDLIKNDHSTHHAVATPADSERLTNLIKEQQPKILAFNGKKPAMIFLNETDTKAISYGEQKNRRLGSTKIYVLPSTSGAAKAFFKLGPWQEVCRILKK